jgi:RHS repeat-associated protein
MPMMQGAIATTQPGACSSSVAFPSTYKFTGKERDAESGLDNFEARYLGSSMGRFMSPDPDQESGIDNMGDPQMWNGYSYVGNSATNRTDPTGRTVSICDANGNYCQGVSDENYAQAQQQDQYNHAASLDQLKQNEGSPSNITDSNGNVVGTVMYTPNPGTYPTEGIQPLDGQIYGGLVAGWGMGKVFGVLGRVTGWSGSGAGAAGTAAGEAAGQLGALAGGTIERIFQTSAGPVHVLVEVTAEGQTAVVDMAVYPAAQKGALEVGQTAMRQIFNQLGAELKEQGFTAVRVATWRSGESGVAEGAGRFVNLTVKLK